MGHPSVQILALLFAAAIGLALGTLGGGGSVLTVPVLVYLLGYDPKIAVPTSLGVVGAASLMGAVGHWRAGRVDLRVALAFGLVTMVGAFTGAWLATYLTGGLQLSILAVVMIAAAILMLRPRALTSTAAMPSRAGDVEHEEPAAATRQVVRLIPVGAGVGVLTGLVGVGGGFLIVPALVLWGGVEMPTAVGTSQLVITLNCATGLAGYAGRVALPWGETALFTTVAVIGAACGTAIVGSVPPQRLRQTFAVFLLGVGAFVMYRNRHVFIGQESIFRTWPPAAQLRVR
jgi:uncharacterized membrane protein YfcA